MLFSRDETGEDSSAGAGGDKFAAQSGRRRLMAAMRSASSALR